MASRSPAGLRAPEEGLMNSVPLCAVKLSKEYFFFRGTLQRPKHVHVPLR
jgi:hypothetical protein